MTTYSSNINLSEQELWSLEAAMKFYLSPEATTLRKDNPQLAPWFLMTEQVLKEMIQNQKLREGLELASTNSKHWNRGAD